MNALTCNWYLRQLVEVGLLRHCDKKNYFISIANNNIIINLYRQVPN